MKFARKRRAARQDRELDRAGVVAAARDVLDELGLAASMAEIAGHAGIDLATLSRQFRDRDELIGAVLDDLAESLRDDGGTEPGARFPAAIPRIALRQVVPPLAVMAALLPLGAAPTAAAAVEEPAPVTVLTVSPLWPVMPINGALGGSLCQSNSCTSVPYVPFFTPGGVKALDNRLSASAAQLAATGGSTIVLGFSNGALVAEKWLAEHAGDPGEPSPDELSFVLIGNPRRAYGGSMPALPPTDYHVIDIVQQYDPLADFPDNPLNLLAMANIALGIFSPLHLDYSGVDLDDPANTVWTEGNTTYVFVPTENLPLLAPLLLMGMNQLADKLNEPLKEIVERAYDRPYLTTPATEGTDQPDQLEETEQTATAAAAVQTAAVQTAAAKTAVRDDATPPASSRKLFQRLSPTKKAAGESADTAEVSDDSDTADSSDTAEVSGTSDDGSSPAADTTTTSTAAANDNSTVGATPQTRKAPHKRGLLHRSTG